jgi:hypothetical protein
LKEDSQSSEREIWVTILNKDDNNGIFNTIGIIQCFILAQYFLLFNNDQINRIISNVKKTTISPMKKLDRVIVSISLPVIHFTASLVYFIIKSYPQLIRIMNNIGGMRAIVHVLIQFFRLDNFILNIKN